MAKAHTIPDSVTTPTSDRFGWLVLVVALVLGIALRAWIATHDQGTYWADEIYQSLEPAHRLAFGYGLLPWEFIQGARTWVFPGLIAGLMKISSWVGLNAPWQYLGLIRAALVANATATIVGSYLLARRLMAKPVPAALAALLLALWPTAIYFSFRAFSEVATSGLVVFGLWLLLDREDRPAWHDFLAVGLLTLATAIRLQNLIFLVGGIALPFSFGEWRRGGRLVLAGLIGLLAIGLLDRLTWGSWFHSTLIYLAFNATGASGWGTAPFSYYWTTIQQSLGLCWIPLAVLLVLGLRRGWRLAIIAAIFLLAHANVPHKELRFIYPIFALVAALIGSGVGELWDWLRPTWARAALTVTVLALILWLGRSPSQITRAAVDVKVIDAASDPTRAYGQYDSENRLLWVANQQPDLCGLGLDLAPVSTGGYSYLHRNVPLFSNSGPHDQAQFYNYKIETIGDKTPGTTVATIGQRKLVKLPNATCRTDPAYQSPSL